MVATLLAPVIALITVVAVVATLPTWVTPERVRRETVDAAREALGVEVELASLDYDLAWGLELRGLRVGPPAGFTRDVLVLRGLDLRWKLPWSRSEPLVIERAALIEPHLVVETVNGRRNLDVLLPPSDEAPPPEEPASPLEGPLSPIELIVREVAIERARVELVGEGPNASIDGLSVRLDAALDPEKLRARLVVTATGSQIVARVPRPGLPDQRVETRLDARLEATVAARAHDGLHLDLATFDATVSASGLDLFGSPPIPRADVAFEAGARLDAGADTFAIDRVVLRLDERELLRVGLRVDGVVAAVMEAVADPGSLIAALGLVRSARAGRVTLTGPGVTLPLEPLAPYIAPFAPGLELSGEARLVVDDVSGRVGELMATRPERGGVRLELERLRVRDRARGLSVGALDGQLAIAAAGAAPLAIRGRFQGARLASGPSSIETFSVGADGTVERPAYPVTGTVALTLTVGLGGVRAPGAEVDDLDVALTLRGADPLDPARAQRAPVAVGVELDLRGVRVGSGTAAQSLATLGARLDAQLDRLLAPALRPIDAKLTASIGGYGSTAVHVQTAKAALETTLDDPRHGRPIAVRLRGVVEAEGARAQAATVGRARWSIDTRLTGVDPTGKDPLPARALVDTTLELPAFALAPPSTLATHARVDAKVDFTKAGQKVVIDQLRAQMGDVVDASLTGRVARALSAEPELDVAFELAPLDLGKPVVAKALGEPFTGRGTVRFQARARGRWTGADDLLARLDAPPLETTATLTLDEVSASMPRRDLSLERATGSMSVTLSRAEAGTRGELRLGAAAQGPQGARDLVASWALGLDEGVWRARATLDAARLGDARHTVQAATVDLDVVHPPFGDVMVRRFRVEAPGAGVVMGLDGRLARGRYGAVLPHLDAAISLDLDRLKSVFGAAVPPALAQCSGAVGLELRARAPTDARVELGGALTLDGFSWQSAGTRLVDASGRMPFSQSLVVDEPTDRLITGRERATSALAEGGLGLRASLEDLLDALQRRSRLVLSASDVLVTAPRTADYESLRPYYRARSAAKLTVRELSYAHYRLMRVSMDAAYRDGIFSVDRFATELWEGAMFAELAFQIAGQDHLRLRMRGTLTDINLDVPVAAATGREPERGSDAEPYQVTGNLDVRIDLRDRSLDGYFDFTKMGAEALVGLIDGIDPERKSQGLQQTRASISSGMENLEVWTGVRLEGTVMTIRNNLLDLDYKWAYNPIAPPSALFYLGLPFVTRPILGTPFMRTMNTAVKGYSLSSYLEAPWVKGLNESVFTDALRGRLVIEDQGALARGAAE